MAKEKRKGIEADRREVVCLAGELTVQQGLALQQELRQALDRAAHVVQLDLSRVTGVDIAFFQMICAAHRSAVDKKKKLSFLPDGMPGVVHDLMKAAGFKRHIGCLRGEDQGCMWCEENEAWQNVS